MLLATSLPPFRSCCSPSWKSLRKAAIWWWWSAQRPSTPCCTSSSSGSRTIPKRTRLWSKPSPLARRPQQMTQHRLPKQAASLWTSNRQGLAERWRWCSDEGCFFENGWFALGLHLRRAEGCFSVRNKESVSWAWLRKDDSPPWAREQGNVETWLLEAKRED